MINASITVRQTAEAIPVGVLQWNDTQDGGAVAQYTEVRLGRWA